MKFLILFTSTLLFAAEPSSSMFNKLKEDKQTGLTKAENIKPVEVSSKVEKVNTLSNNTSSENKELKDSLYIDSVKKEILQKWFIANGYAKMSFIIDTNTGKVLKTLVSEKIGNETFVSDLNRFSKEVLSLELPKGSYSSPILELFISFGSKDAASSVALPVKKGLVDLTLFSKEQNRYKDVVSFLMKERGLSKEDIKKELNKNSNSLVKNLLFAIYYEFEKKDMKLAVENYELVVNNHIQRFIKMRDAFFIADYLINTKRFKEILTIFPERSCPLYQDMKNRNDCFYYQSVAKFFLHEDYELPLQQIRDMKKAEEFDDAIKRGDFK